MPVTAGWRGLCGVHADYCRHKNPLDSDHPCPVFLSPELFSLRLYPPQKVEVRKGVKQTP
jgi:hypothetical protein